MLSAFIKNEEGATAIEYGLIAALIAIVIISAVTALGGQVSDTFTHVTDSLSGSGAGTGGAGGSGGGSDFGSGGADGSGGAGGGFF